VYGLAAGIAVVCGVGRVWGQECVLHERQRLAASDAVGGENFGISVSISGEWFLVGAWRRGDPRPNAGSAYIFRLDDSGTPLDPKDDRWVEAGGLTGLDTAAGDRFGISVSINDDYALVGAVFGTNLEFDSGSAYVFRRDDNGTPGDRGDDTWVQVDKLTASDGAEGDWFGASVSVSGDRAIVGAYRVDADCPADDRGCDTGAAYVFRRDDNGTPLEPGDDFWIEEDKLSASDAAAGDTFGISVSISDDRAIVGAFLSDAAGEDSGAAYVFWRDDNGTPLDPGDDFWVEEDKLTPSDLAEGDSFGIAVSIDGDLAVVGSPFDDDGAIDAGSAYVFALEDNGTPSDKSDDFWVDVAKLTASDPALGNEFGGSVAIDGDLIVVGSRYDDDAGEDSGSAYVFKRVDDPASGESGGRWVQRAKLSPSDAAEGDSFGVSVSISGERAVVGAWYDDDAGADSGSAYVFSVGRDCGTLAHFSGFQACFTGDGGGMLLGCADFDLDGDEDVDLTDHQQLLSIFTGP
jgi:hypothetical protein